MGRWKPSKTRAREFAKKMDEIRDYCAEHGIDHSASMDSFYFFHNGEHYRVSNHTVAQSNRGAYNWLGEKVRDEYHAAGEFDREHEITASKTRLIEVHQAIVAGKKINKRGYVID